MGLPLVTLAEVKAYAGITSNNQDVEINALIPRVSELVKSYCSRTFIDFVNDSAIEVTNGGDSSFIYTEEPSIITISSLEYSTDYGLTYTALTEYTDYVLDTGRDRIFAVPGGLLNGKFKDLTNGYKVTYNAGFVDAVVPDDLKQAVIDIVMYYSKHDMAVKSNKAGGTNTVQIEYILQPGFPEHIERILNLYARDFV